MGRRVSSRLWVWVVLSLFLACGPAPAATLTEEAPELVATPLGETAAAVAPKKKMGWFGTRCQKAVLAAALVATTALVPTAFHSANAARQGKEHLGRGIYLNMDSVRDALTAEERAVLENAQSDPYEATSLLVDKLNGDYGNWLFTPFALPSDASEYLKGTGGKDRGVCRHKACVLAGVLQAKGVTAVMQSGTTYATPYSWHVWVYLPDLDLIADPTSGRIMKSDLYLESFEFHMNGVPLADGWY